MNKNSWKVVVKLIIAIATAILGVLGAGQTENAD